MPLLRAVAQPNNLALNLVAAATGAAAHQAGEQIFGRVCPEARLWRRNRQRPDDRCRSQCRGHVLVEMACLTGAGLPVFYRLPKLIIDDPQFPAPR